MSVAACLPVMKYMSFVSLLKSFGLLAINHACIALTHAVYLEIGGTLYLTLAVIEVI